MNFINKQYIHRFQCGQYCRQIALLGQHRRGRCTKICSQFICHNMCQRRFPQSRRPIQQHMVHGFATTACTRNKHRQILFQTVMSNKIPQRSRTNGRRHIIWDICIQKTFFTHKNSSYFYSVFKVQSAEYSYLTSLALSLLFYLAFLQCHDNL